MPEECQSIPITRPERLEPVRIAEAREKRRVAVVEQNALDDRGAELRHAVGQPRRHTAAMQRQVRESRALHKAMVAGRSQTFVPN